MEVTRSPALGNKAPRPEQQQQGSRGAAQTPPRHQQSPPDVGWVPGGAGGPHPCGVCTREAGGCRCSAVTGEHHGGGGLRSDPQAASRKIPRTSAGLSAGLPLLHSPAGSLSRGQEQAAATAQPRHGGGGHPRATGQRGRRRGGSPRSHGCQTPHACSTGCCLP